MSAESWMPRTVTKSRVLISRTRFIDFRSAENRRDHGGVAHRVRILVVILEKRWPTTCSGHISGILNASEYGRTFRSGLAFAAVAFRRQGWGAVMAGRAIRPFFGGVGGVKGFRELIWWDTALRGCPVGA